MGGQLPGGGQVVYRYPDRTGVGGLDGAMEKPDVLVYAGQRVAFEIQLSTTYLDVIAGRRDFYLEQGGLLFWIFARFDTERLRMTDDDVFWQQQTSMRSWFTRKVWTLRWRRVRSSWNAFGRFRWLMEDFGPPPEVGALRRVDAGYRAQQRANTTTSTKPRRFENPGWRQNSIASAGLRTDVRGESIGGEGPGGLVGRRFWFARLVSRLSITHGICRLNCCKAFIQPSWGSHSPVRENCSWSRGIRWRRANPCSVGSARRFGTLRTRRPAQKRRPFGLWAQGQRLKGPNAKDPDFRRTVPTRRWSNSCFQSFAR